MTSLRRRPASTLLVTALFHFALATVGVASSADLYQARTIVTGRSEATRNPGLAKCLEDVLVKVSGDPRLIGTPEVAMLARNAGAYVEDFRYHDRMSGIPVHDEQGTRDRPYDLIVSFRPEKIDAALRSLGREPWTTPRPRLAMFVSIRNGANAYVLVADGEHGKGQRDALAAAAMRYGLSVVLPEQSIVEDAALAGTLPETDAARLKAVARAIETDLPIAGSLNWNQKDLGWVADWRLVGEGRVHRWQIRGVSFDEAYRSAIRGAGRILSGHGQPD